MEYERNSNLRTDRYDLFFLEDLVLELEAFARESFLPNRVLQRASHGEKR